MASSWILLIVAVMAVILAVSLWLTLAVMPPWVRALLSGAPVSFLHIMAMRLRGNSPRVIVDAYILLRHRGAVVNIADVERTYVAQGRTLGDPATLADLVRIGDANASGR